MRRSSEVRGAEGRTLTFGFLAVEAAACVTDLTWAVGTRVRTPPPTWIACLGR